jgi:orotate phosphoribosyltransferase
MYALARNSETLCFVVCILHPLSGSSTVRFNVQSTKHKAQTEENRMVELIPSQDAVMQILKRTGAFREGHFIYPNGKHSPHYFQMPLAFRYYDTARVLAVALSRKFRLEKDISSQLPKVAVISPSSGGIPVAFGVRDALNAEQIYWAEQEKGERMFRQYVNQGEVNPCIIVDDIIRSGNAIDETVTLVNSLGARMIGCGAIVRFESAPKDVDGVPIKSLVDFDARMYDGEHDCPECKEKIAAETVRF